MKTLLLLLLPLLSLAQLPRQPHQGQYTPSLLVDFTKATLPGSYTVTRADASATRYNASGVLVSVPANTARFDYDPATLVCRGLLIEETRTNLMLQSNTFDNGQWQKANINVTANQTAGLDGAQSADLYAENSSNSEHNFYQAFTPVAGQAYTFSVHLKEGSRRYADLQIGNPGNRYHIVIDTRTGTITATNTVGSPPATRNAIRAVANGWYRAEVSFTPGNGDQSYAVISLCNVAVPTNLDQYGQPLYQGDGSSGLYAWGAQVEAGNASTSYIPTTSGTVTRNADQIVGSIGTWYNPKESTWLIEGLANRAEAALLDIWNSASNKISMRQQGSILYKYNGSDQMGFSGSGLSAVARIGTAYRSNDGAMSKGGSLTTGSTITLYTPTGLYLGVTDRNLYYINGYVRALRYWPRRVPNKVLQKLTQ